MVAFSMFDAASCIITNILYLVQLFYCYFLTDFLRDEWIVYLPSFAEMEEIMVE
jgi:hypothetical protein